MSNSTPFYRKYVRGVVSKANSQKVALQRDIVYMQLVKWLRNKNTRLEKEMFNAVLNSSKKLAKDYLSSGTEDIKSACEESFFFHTFTASDGTHTDVKQVQKYVSDFWKPLKVILDEEKLLGDATLRMRQLDVVRLGKLFDKVLDLVPDERKSDAIELMDEFVRSDLEEL